MSDARSIAVVGLGFGDEGKGTITDYLTRKHRAKLVVRFNGGPNAGHNVVTVEARHHCFSQFGSGTLAGANTLLSHFVVVDPMAMSEEACHLLTLGVRPKAFVDWNCLVVTPYHRLANQARERKRGDARHGSVGIGLGEAVGRAEADPNGALRVRDFYDRDVVEGKLTDLAKNVDAEFGPSASGSKMLAPEYLAEIYERWLRQPYVDVVTEHDALNLVKHTPGPILFEGAQGVLLDQHYGFFPHVTRSTCTFANAAQLASDWGIEPPRRVGVLRTYHTRHGAGPLPTEITDGESRPFKRQEEHNPPHDWQGTFRDGHFDLELARYAIETAEPEEVALTHMDVPISRVGTEYWLDGGRACLATGIKTYTTTPGIQSVVAGLLDMVKVSYLSVPDVETVVRLIQITTGRAVTLRSHGPTAAQKVGT